MKIDLCGLCGSDLHAYLGKEKGCEVKTISGHEAVGVIVETSVDCKHWLGKTVVVPFSTNCGACKMCEASLPSRCENGQLLGWVDAETKIGLQGCQAEYALIPLAESTVVEISTIAPTITPEDALLCGDILSTAYFSVMNGIQEKVDIRAPWKKCWVSKKLLIIGCGPVGLLASLCASYLVPEEIEIYVYDLVESRKQEATRFGAKAADATDLKPDFDVVVECVGAKGALKSALSS
ncbi:MAG: alcohol dehydrogenase catalytic domain-containing protein, partial [Cytophagales bacterium]|nr:alcohol dehydrogenase catalytic domain-containing protein [Cytophagales bacterium]